MPSLKNLLIMPDARVSLRLKDMGPLEASVRVEGLLCYSL